MSATKRGFTSEAGQAEASGHMVGRPTVCVLATHVGKAADIHTFVSHAGALTGTVGVADALEW